MNHQHQEQLPIRILHIQTVHTYGERNSLVHVEPDEYEQQQEAAKAKHRKHFRLDVEDCLETIAAPVQGWEYEKLSRDVVTLK